MAPRIDSQPHGWGSSGVVRIQSSSCARTGSAISPRAEARGDRLGAGLVEAVEQPAGDALVVRVVLEQLEIGAGGALRLAREQIEIGQVLAIDQRGRVREQGARGFESIAERERERLLARRGVGRQLALVHA
jgi:hypothetical protein